MSNLARAFSLGRACFFMFCLASTCGKRQGADDILRLVNDELEGAKAGQSGPEGRRNAVIDPEQEIVQELKTITDNSPAVFRNSDMTSLKNQVKEIHDSVVQDKNTQNIGKAVEMTTKITTGLSTLKAACASGSCDPVKTAQGVMSLVAAGAVLVAPPAGPLVAGLAGVTSMILGLVDSDQSHGPPMEKIVYGEVVRGLKLFEELHQQKNIEKAKKALRDLQDTTNIMMKITTGKDDPHLISMNNLAHDAATTILKKLTELEVWIKKAPEAETITYTDLTNYNLETSCLDDRSWMQTGAWHAVPCRLALMAHCRWHDISNIKFNDEKTPDAIQDFFKTLGEVIKIDNTDPEAYPENCFDAHFPKGHVSQKCIGGFTIYKEKVDIASTWQSMPQLTHLYFTMQALTLAQVVRLKNIWGTHVEAQKWESIRKNTLEDMSKIRDFFAERSRTEDDKIHQFNMKMQDQVCEWRQSKTRANRIQGWMRAWFERPEMFNRSAGRASDTANAFLNTLKEPDSQPECPYIALEFGQNCHDNLYAAELDDPNQCREADLAECFTRPQSLNTDSWFRKGLSGDYDRGNVKTTHTQTRPSGCFVEDVNEGGLGWNTYPSGSNANYVSAFPVCKNLKSERWSPLGYIERSLVADEGRHLKTIAPFISLEDCKLQCTGTIGCNSFALCKPTTENPNGPTGCYMKAKVVTMGSPARTGGGWQVPNCRTYFKHATSR